MKDLRRVNEVTKRDRICSQEIREELQIEPAVEYIRNTSMGIYNIYTTKKSKTEANLGRQNWEGFERERGNLE